MSSLKIKEDEALELRNLIEEDKVSSTTVEKRDFQDYSKLNNFRSKERIAKKEGYSVIVRRKFIDVTSLSEKASKCVYFVLFLIGLFALIVFFLAIFHRIQ